MALEPRGHEQAAAHCKALAAKSVWNHQVLSTWPSPVATEFWRLRHELEHGRTMDAMLQLKDLAELLIKLPVLMATRLLLDHGGAAQQAQTRQLLLASFAPTLGVWHSEGFKLTRQAVELPQSAPFRGPLSLVLDARGKASGLWKCLGEQVIPWRNQELAHGALKLDLAEFAIAFETVLAPLLENLDACAAAWHGVSLTLPDAASPALRGSDALDDAAPWLQQMGEESWQPLVLRGENQGSQVLMDFGPYLCLRKSESGSGVHCYVLNKRIKTPRPGIHLLEYQHAHTAVCLRSEGGERFDGELDAMHDEPDRESGLQDPTVRDFLDRVSIRHEYVEPKYLRRWLADFVGQPGRDRGLAWLRGPGDVGKTLFSFGLATLGSIAQMLGREQPEPLLPQLEVLVVPLRKEYRCTPPSLSSEVQRAIDKVAGDRFLGLEGSLRDAQWSGDAPGAFCAWLELVRTICGCDPRQGKRLLIVLDGLDELPAPDPRVDGGSIIDLLPPAQRLPEGVFLLATSRPGDAATAVQDRCPAFVYHKLNAAWQASAPELRAEYILDPQHNPEYRQVLEQFFRNRALPALKKAGVDPATSFERTLRVASFRFKWLSHYAALLGSGSASIDDLEALSTDPLRKHLQALQKYEPRKRYEIIRAILLELAAAEEAHLAEVKASEPSPVLDPQWLGLEVLELARRVGYQAESARGLEPRFISALYSVGELLRSYRGAASDSSRFALGLKGMLQHMLALEDWGTADLHWRCMWTGFSDSNAARNDQARLAALLRVAGASLALAEQGHTGLVDKQVVQSIDDVVTGVAQHVAETTLDYASAMRLCALGTAAWRLCKPDGDADPTPPNMLAAWYSQRGVYRSSVNQLAEAIDDYGRAIALMEDLRELLGAQWPPAFRNDLAAAYMNRGVAHQNSNALAEAIDDYGRAIALMEGLRELLGAQWPPAFRNDLAAAYMNRGNAHQRGNALAEAIDDSGRAIALREGLRELLGAQWPPAFRNDLAAAYMNRGVAHQNSYALAEAIDDFGRAIALMEDLRELLGAQWPPAFRNDLAAAYLNRGNAHQSGNALAEAIDDYGRAIALMEGLRELLGAQWPPAFRNDLAAAYMNRGVAHQNSNALAEAIDDYGRAIALREDLRELLGAQWPPAFRNDLAGAYVNRGNAHLSGNALAEAIDDYGRAIALREGLRELLGAQWPPAFRNALAAAYMNRGVAHQNSNALAEAIDDYGRAIALMEGLRELLGAQWPPAFRDALAAAYMNRGVAQQSGNALAEAIDDYGRAIALMEDLRELLGAQWPPAFRAGLALALRNRAEAWARVGDLAAAKRDTERAEDLPCE